MAVYQENKKINAFNWVLGMLLASLGIAFSTKASLGLSMISAAPYIVHVALRDLWPWYTQGMSEYVLQAVELLICCLIIRKFSWKYLLSFMTALIVGFMLDGWLLLLGGNGAYASWLGKILAFLFGAAILSLGIAFFFRTTLPMQVPEFCVTALAERFSVPQARMKWFFDIFMLAVSVVLDLALLHGFHGVGIGTVVVTVINAPMIAGFGKLIDHFEK